LAAATTILFPSQRALKYVYEYDHKGKKKTKGIKTNFSSITKMFLFMRSFPGADLIMRETRFSGRFQRERNYFVQKTIFVSSH
jgi:hypothetical protein